MARIELEHLLKPTTTPEQQIFLTMFYTLFDNKSASNRSIINVEPLFFQGTIAGSEFLTYAATKLYICYSLICSNSATNTVSSEVVLYDETNTVVMINTKAVAFWNTTTAAINFVRRDVEIQNTFFSRFAITDLIRVKFNGYRITLQ